MPEDDRTLKTFLFQFNYFPKASAPKPDADAVESGAAEEDRDAETPRALADRRALRARRGSAA